MNRSATSAPASTSTAASILAAAREILNREGHAAVTMRPVAQRVGITPMAIYRHYADRASLLNALADEGFQDLATRLQTLQLKGGVENRLVQVGDVFLDAALQFPNLYELMFLVPREGARVYPKDFKAGRSPTFNPTVSILKGAMRTGELRPDNSIEIAFELSAMSHGLIAMYLGRRIEQNEKQFRILHRRSFTRYLNGLRP
jgi:AcrR family transcriptional regulator